MPTKSTREGRLEGHFHCSGCWAVNCSLELAFCTDTVRCSDLWNPDYKYSPGPVEEREQLGSMKIRKPPMWGDLISLPLQMGLKKTLHWQSMKEKREYCTASYHQCRGGVWIVLPPMLGLLLSLLTPMLGVIVVDTDLNNGSYYCDHWHRCRGLLHSMSLLADNIVGTDTNVGYSTLMTAVLQCLNLNHCAALFPTVQIKKNNIQWDRKIDIFYAMLFCWKS